MTRSGSAAPESRPRWTTSDSAARFKQNHKKGWGVKTSAGRAGQEVGKGCARFESRHSFEVRAAPRERRTVDVLEVVRELVVDRLRSGQDNQPAKSET